MNLKLVKQVLVAVVSVLFITIAVEDGEAYANTNPFSVETSVRNAWNGGTIKWGGKDYGWTSGRKIVYDVYSSKFRSGGWVVANKTFSGSTTGGSEPYLIFDGWSVLAGYKTHTTSNHSTHIVLKKTSGDSGVGTTKIYNTYTRTEDATEDLEYNNQGGGVWNQCSTSTTNQNNTSCNMRYEDVAFTAYIPLMDIFPNSGENANWDMYIVKRVDSQIVGVALRVPFNFSNLNYNGGTLDLSSGVNANKLIMNDYPVIRRDYARQTAASAGNFYFTQWRTYNRVSSDEGDTAVWYEVRNDFDSAPATWFEWANTTYWTFGGSQASLSYTPPPDNLPPEHISHEFINARYVNGNDYWVQPNDQAYVRLRQRDPDSGNLFQYVQFIGSGDDVRSQHDFRDTTTHNNNFETDPGVVINSASREENTSYGKVKWGVIGKTHAESYDIKYYYRDKNNNSIGYNDTGMNMRVDGVEPQHNSQGIYDYRYQNGNDYWVRPDDTLYVQLRQYDPHSGNYANYIQLAGSGVDVRSQHRYDLATNHNNQFLPDSAVSIDSAERLEDSYYGMVKWNITPKTHGHSYYVSYHYIDNADNATNSSGTPVYNGTSFNIRVDGEYPYNVTEEITGHRYLNGTTYWIRPGDVVDVRLRGSDDDSGLQRTALSLGSGSDRDTMYHDWHGTSTNMSGGNTNSDYDIISVSETYESGSSKEVTWKVEGYTHGVRVGVRHYYQDNVAINSVGDSFGWSSFDKYIDIDGVVPNIAFRNSADTVAFTSRAWDTASVNVRLKFSDPDSGYKQSRYKWSLSAATPSTWSSWSASSNYVVSQSTYGAWYLHVQAEDNVGNVVTTYEGPFRFNNAPNAAFSTDQTWYYVGDTMSVISLATDPDGNSLTYDYTITQPDGSTVTRTTADFTYKFPDMPGTYTVRQDVTDEHGASDWVATTIPVQDLTLTGHVKHTPSWQNRHTQIGNTPLQFYSGEVFVLEADVIDHPIDRVEVDFEGYQDNGNLYTSNFLLSGSSPVLYTGTLEDQQFAEGGTRLSNGNPEFSFTVYYSNGIIRNDKVVVEIIGSVYDAFKYHKLH